MGKLRSQCVLKAMELMEYDAVAVGEKELRVGVSQSRQLLQNSRFETLSATYVFDETEAPLWKPYHVFEIPRFRETGQANDLLRVGVLAANTPPESRSRYDEDGVVVRALPLRRTLDLYLESLVRDSDIQILLGHFPNTEIRSLVREYPDIDLVTATYFGERTSPGLRIGNTWIAYAGRDGKLVGECRLFLNARGTSIEKANVRFVEMSKKIPDDPKIRTLLDDTKESIRQFHRDQKAKTQGNKKRKGKSQKQQRG